MVPGGVTGLLASVFVLSVVVPAGGQWRQIVDPWGHGPVRVANVAPRPPQPYYQPRPAPYHQPPPQQPQPQPQQQAMPTHWNRQPPQPMQQQPQYPPPQQHYQHQQSGAIRGSVHTAPAPAPAAAAAPAAKAEPLEIEGPTTTPKPTAPAYYQGGYPGYGGGHQSAPAPQQPPQWPSQHHQPPPPQNWGAARVQPPYRPPPVPAPIPHPPQLQYQRPAQTRPAFGPSPPYPQPGPQQPGPQQLGPHQLGPHQLGPQQPVPLHAHTSQTGAGHHDPLSKYDVFSSNFDVISFQRTAMQARETTQSPIMAAMGGSGAVGTGNSEFSINSWAQSIANSFAQLTTTTPLPPTTTPNHMVHINPYRHGGLFLADPNKKPMKKPATQIIEMLKIDIGAGVTINPMMGFLGKTNAPAVKETTPLPGRDGNMLSGWFGFHSGDAKTTPPPKEASNQIQNKLQTFFAPVPNLPQQQQPVSGGGAGGPSMTALEQELKRKVCQQLGLTC